MEVGDLTLGETHRNHLFFRPLRSSPGDLRRLGNDDPSIGEHHPAGEGKGPPTQARIWPIQVQDQRVLPWRNWMGTAR